MPKQGGEFRMPLPNPYCSDNRPTGNRIDELYPVEPSDELEGLERLMPQPQSGIRDPRDVGRRTLLPNNFATPTETSSS